jgi:hypothetical protein
MDLRRESRSSSLIVETGAEVDVYVREMEPSSCAVSM